MTAQSLSQHRIDVIKRVVTGRAFIAAMIALVLALAAGVFSFTRSAMFEPAVYEYFGYGTDATNGLQTTNLLFDGDTPKIKQIMTDRFSEKHAHAYEHPLISLVIAPPVQVFIALGFETLDAIRIVVALLCGAWTLLMFALLYLWTGRILDAAVFTLLANASAAAVFWFSVPEVFPFGSATMLAAFILFVLPNRDGNFVWRDTAAIVLTLSMTVTNSMVGLAMAAWRLSIKHMWLTVSGALLVTTALYGVQKYVFPSSEYFFPPRSGWVATYLFAPEPMRILEVVRAFFAHAMVMPEISILTGSQLHLPDSADSMASVQASSIFSSGATGIAAVLAWFGLLGIGAWTIFKQKPALGVLAGIIIAGQIALHVVFGSETFLYTTHFLPLLMIVAAAASLGKLRMVGLALAVVVTALAGANNWKQFTFTTDFVREVDERARNFTPVGTESSGEQSSPGAQPS